MAQRVRIFTNEQVLLEDNKVSTIKDITPIIECNVDGGSSISIYGGVQYNMDGGHSSI